MTRIRGMARDLDELLQAPTLVHGTPETSRARAIGPDPRDSGRPHGLGQVPALGRLAAQGAAGGTVRLGVEAGTEAQADARREHPLADTAGQPFSFRIIEAIQEELHGIDFLTGGMVRMPEAVTDPETRQRFLAR